MARPSHPVTLEVVAAHAGVSRQTVSNALNAPGKLRPDTLQRVQESITLLGYRPDRHARSLRTRASGVLGYSLPPGGTGGLADRFLPALCQAVAASGTALGLPAGDRLIARDQDGIAGGRAGGRRLLDRTPRPTAVVAVSDELAFGALHAIAERGLRAGPDIAVTGVGDVPACLAVRPALTTVRLPVEEMAQRAVRLLDGAAVPMLASSRGLLLAPRSWSGTALPPPLRPRQPDP